MASLCHLLILFVYYSTLKMFPTPSIVTLFLHSSTDSTANLTTRPECLKTAHHRTSPHITNLWA